MTPFKEATSCPPGLRLQGASFYSGGGSITNIRAGRKDNYECVSFDFDSNVEFGYTDTIVAVKTQSPKQPTTWLSRSSGLRLERVGEWIFVFQREVYLDPEKVESAVEDAIKLIEYAREFPQNE